MTIQVFKKTVVVTDFQDRHSTIAVKSFGWFNCIRYSHSSSYAKLKSDNKTLLVKVADLAWRLGMSVPHVQAALNRNSLAQVLAYRNKQVVVISEEATQACTRVSDLIVRCKSPILYIKEKTILDVIKIGHQWIDEMDKEHITEDCQITFSKNELIFTAQVKKGGHCSLIGHFGKLIGAGNFGHVSTQFDLLEGKEIEDSVIKSTCVKSLLDLSNNNKIKSANKQIENEHQMILRANNSGPIIGLIGASKQKLAMSDGVALIGLELDKYDSDLYGATLEFEELISIFWQVAHGLNHLHLNDQVHHDIKPKNILVKKAAESGLGVIGVLSDFGGSQVLKKTELDNCLFGTAHYIFISDSEVPRDNPNVRKELFKAKDVAAFCKTVIEYLDPAGAESSFRLIETESSPHVFCSISRPGMNVLKVALEKAVGSQLCEILLKGIEPNYKIRPSVGELEQALAKKFEEISQEHFNKFLKLVSKENKTKYSQFV